MFRCDIIQTKLSKREKKVDILKIKINLMDKSNN